MTTTARPAPGQPRGTTHRVLLGAGVATVLPVLVLAALGGLLVGPAAGWGAVVGGGLSLALLFGGALLVASATAVSPQMSLLVAMTTFLTVVVMAAAAFYALDTTGFIGRVADARWVAGGVAVAGVSWSLAHLVGHARSRILAFDLTPESRAPSSARGAQSHGAPQEAVPTGTAPVDGGPEVRAS